MPDTLSADADYPPCPFCESNVFVSGNPSNDVDWWCHWHEVGFGGDAVDAESVRSASASLSPEGERS